MPGEGGSKVSPKFYGALYCNVSLYFATYNSVQMFEPFWDRNSHFYGIFRLSWFFMQDFQKRIDSVVLGPNHSGKFFGGRNLDFCESYFLWPFCNGVFWTNMESNAAVTLHFEDLAVNNYLCTFTCEKSQIVLLSTFDQCEVFLFKYFED